MWRAGKPCDDFEFDKIADYLAEDDTLVWFDMFDPDHASLSDLAGSSGSTTGRWRTRWQCENGSVATVYRTHTFFTVYAVQVLDTDVDSKSALAIHRISGFVLPRV